MKLYIHERISDGVVEDILQGQCDFGVFISDAASLRRYSGHADLVIGHLFAEKVYIIAQATSPLAGRSSVTLEDIKDHPLSTTNFNKGYWRRGNLFDDAIDMNIVLTTDNIFLMQAHIEKGASIGIMTNSSLNRLPLKEGLAAVPLHLTYPSSVYCVYQQGVPWYRSAHRLPYTSS